MMFVESNRYGTCLFLTSLIWERAAIVYLRKHGKSIPCIKKHYLKQKSKKYRRGIMESKSVVDIIFLRSLRFKKITSTYIHIYSAMYKNNKGQEEDILPKLIQT